MAEWQAQKGTASPLRSHAIRSTTGREARRKAPPYGHNQWTLGTGQPSLALARVGNRPDAREEKDASRSKGPA